MSTKDLFSLTNLCLQLYLKIKRYSNTQCILNLFLLFIIYYLLFIIYCNRIGQQVAELAQGRYNS